MERSNTLHRTVNAVVIPCLLVLAAGYVQQRRQVAEQQQELELLRRRVEKEHKQLWLYGLYIPSLEQRLVAAHAKGTPAAWRAFVMQREAERVQEQSARNRAGFERYLERTERGGQ
jgi:hypothetical protein